MILLLDHKLWDGHVVTKSDRWVSSDTKTIQMQTSVLTSMI